LPFYHTVIIQVLFLQSGTPGARGRPLRQSTGAASRPSDYGLASSAQLGPPPARSALKNQLRL
jgi:hypothetical protein